MIFVDRSRIPAPEILDSHRAKKARSKAREFFSKKRASRLQQRFAFDPSIWMESAEALAGLFRKKCAYCESPYLSATGSYLDHFRPKALATGLPGDLAATYGECGEDLPDGYWWLAYEWENLYHVCQVCNRNKRNMFPIEGHRVEPGKKGTNLAKEGPLLLDPCLDDAETFFRYEETGQIFPRSELPSGALRRAQLTIEVIGLNRPDLVQMRATAAQEVIHVVHLVPFPATPWTENHLEKVIRPDLAYLGIRRATLREWAVKVSRSLPAPLRVSFIANITQYLHESNRLLAPREAAIVTKEMVNALGSPTEETPKGTAAPPPTTRAGLLKRLWKKEEPKTGRKSPRALGTGGYIEWIEIENFKAIEYLKIDVPTGNPDRVGWKVLLGENGAGKSSVLQAVALTCLGERASKFAYRPERMLRKLPKTGGLAKEGLIRVQLSSAPEPVEMRFSSKGITFSSGSALPVDLVLRGYGPTRLMPRRGRRHAPQAKKISSDSLPRNEAGNLFDPFQPVCDASAWLNGLESKEAFASAALTLKDLLRIPEKTWLHREKGSVIVPLDGLKITIDELSAGYESILVLAVDLMSGVHGTMHDMRNAAGIVLLDEIDAHLHPRWKMEIVAALRRCFPLMQFLATTHEPLCLRSLDAGEVNVMRRVDGKITLENDLPSPAGLRVDQLLTSPLFGLHSTIEPELDQKFMSYYALLAKHDETLTSAQREARDSLKLELSTVGVLGHTRRDQLAYEAIDQFLAQEPLIASREERQQLHEATKRRVASLLGDVASPREPEGTL